MDARMTPASHRLRRAIIERRSDAPDGPQPAATPSPAIARHFRRGCGIDKSEHSAKLDAIIALSMALDRIEQRPEPVRLVGWL
jgi:hypothetical protein